MTFSYFPRPRRLSAERVGKCDENSSYEIYSRDTR